MSEYFPSKTDMPKWFLKCLLVSCLALLLNGCASSRVHPVSQKPFQFGRDTFAFANELIWEYSYDPNGQMHGERQTPPPDFALRCFAVSRAAREFFNHARFDPTAPKLTPHEYSKLVAHVVSRNSRSISKDADRITIPGYANLHDFSRDHESLLKSSCGKAWHSYIQRGNWRMIFPFSRRHQQRTAHQLLARLPTDKPLIVHLVRFPQLTINHAVAIYDAQPTDDGWTFSVYDPNNPEAPVTLTYDWQKRTFHWPRTNYFPGGRVDVYRIYHGLCY